MTTVGEAIVFFCYVNNADGASLHLAGKQLLSEWLRMCNSSYKSDDVAYNEYGKPFFINADFGFNIAHSGNIAVCGCGKELAIGMDLEEIKDIDIDPLKDHFTEQEWAGIMAAENRLVEFYRMWVRKEAFVKAIGKGIFQPLAAIDVRADEVYHEGTPYYLKDIFVQESYMACLATTMQVNDIEVKQLFL